MGGASKLVMLLSSPFPLLPPRASALRLVRHSRVSLARISSISSRNFNSSSRPRLGFQVNVSEQIHSSTSGATREDYYAPPNSKVYSHQWPEWSKLVDSLRACGYFDRLDGSSVVELNWEDGFSVFEDLPEEFVRTVKVCLLFARHRPDLLRSLSRKDIEIVVENGSPFLFRSAVDSERRMKSFLRSFGSNELDFDKAHTVDLMRFLLSYAWNFPDKEGLSSRELVESSVRILLSELVDASRTFQESNLSGTFSKQFPDSFGQSGGPYRQNIEMKRGDWICPKCNFMNFARNMKCLECDEARPKRQLNGGEWECPQCDFFNHGRNVVCLRCDCKQPGEASFRAASPRSGAGYYNESASNHGNMGNGNAFQTLKGTDSSRTSDSVNQSLNRILSRSSAVSETGNSATAEGLNETGTGKNSIPHFASTLNRQPDWKRSDYVPFVPLPSDMFARPQKSKMEEEQETHDKNTIPPKVDYLMNSFSGRSGDSLSSEKPVYQTESKEDKEQAEKSERWFKKVAELHDVPDLASAISDEDFPEIMPMRKGENRFVVSKKKDRSLTSPQYKRRMAMEQSSSTNYVPFVPFPPDYFAKKDKQPETGTSTEKDKGPSSADTAMPETSHVLGKSEGYVTAASDSGAVGNTSFSAKSLGGNQVDHAYGGHSANPTHKLDELRAGDRENWKSVPWKDRSDAAYPVTSSAPESQNSANTRESWKGGFSGKSLEGSLVKESDPLDMSEEAKAERWFRRAAQIKDISELSQIPDEDFPQIMPMRKGVNRFVVSKRKTPLERRLTSPQYRRNLPIVSSEPLKKENNEG